MSSAGKDQIGPDASEVVMIMRGNVGDETEKVHHISVSSILQNPLNNFLALITV